MSTPAGPATPVYTWEPSDADIAARYGVPRDSILRFDTNTSPDVPDFLPEILGGRFDPPLNEYPDTAYRGLADAAAAYVGADRDEIVVGAGADEVLDLLAKAFLPPGGRALLPTPTYAMYRVLTAQRGASTLDVPRSGPDGGFLLDVPAVERAAASCQLVWLCWPNNPTGGAEPRDDLLAVLDALAARQDGGPLVVVDEAYYEFLGMSLVEERRRFPRLVVIRTLSKAFALAGIRVGYAVAARPIIERLERVRPPGSISTVSASIAAAALRRPELAARRVAVLVEERERLVPRLQALGWEVAPSRANFVLTRPREGTDPAAAVEALLRAGCVPRTFDRHGPLGEWLRLTVRTPTQDDRLLAALASFHAPRAGGTTPDRPDLQEVPR